MFSEHYNRMQIEPRLLAHISGDKALTDAYVQGKDLYTEMAINVFKLDREYCVSGALSPCGTYQPRERIKAVLLGIMYGMGSYTLSQNINESIEVAEKYIDDFYEGYPDVKKFVEATHKHVAEYENVETLFGRKRRFPNHKVKARQYHTIADEILSLIGYIPRMIWQEESLPYRLKKAYWDIAGTYNVVNRQSVNTIIQGSGADVMKLALIESDKVCKKHEFKILATIHDEILFEVPEDITEEQVAELENAMLTAVDLNVPVKVDVEAMYRWGKPIDIKEWFAGVKPEK